MAKKKGGKKGKKEKTVKPKVEGALTEVDKTFYELTITDLNRKLARLRSLTQELEEKNETLNEKMTKLDEDRNDVIVYLKRILQEKNEEISELQSGVEKLQEELQGDKEECSNKTVQMEAEYKQMHEQLTSEIKLLEGKLNALEEFRVQREDLMKKFELQESAIEEQENRHKRAIYEIERKFIIAKDKLKKDMETRLLQLSTEFQDATEIRIAATTHRVIRENIAINNELDEMLTVHKRLYTENLEMKNRDKTLKQQAQLHSAEKNKALAKARVQQQVIQKLTTEHEGMVDKLSNYKNIEAEMHESREQLYKSNLKVQSLENTVRVLEQNLHCCKCTISTLETEVCYYQAEATRLEEVLFEAVGTIKEATKVQKQQRITDKGTLAARRENLLNSLFKLMITAKDAKIKKPSLPSVSSTSSIYKKGDLGFVPQETKVLRPKLTGIRTLESQTGSSLNIDPYANVDQISLKTKDLADFNVDSKQESDAETGKSEQSDVFFHESGSELEEHQDLVPQQDEEEVEPTDPLISNPDLMRSSTGRRSSALLDLPLSKSSIKKSI